ncbi:tandem-95 repeat protein [Tahibacter soli]|uniref:Tandem-95 repeat protein n=1 Tax=Tahibacter soli TaxID=2983605 RepID=A0A9X3YM99_9GAMM|nr:tandem-95 repeat protein [Tahibacter soli]MDC8014887.1 tandem-95 repeat protein [Tahibacter soli]
MNLSLQRLLAALAFAAADVSGAATIQLVGGTGFNDATIVSPEGGNTGTTLGQQRTNLFQAAANVWGAALSSSQTIKVSATFTALACTATTGTLGSAGAATNIVLNIGTKQRYFAVALAEALVDQDINGTGVAEINANFNSRVDQNDTSCLGSTRFYYGLTGPAPAGTIALYPVVLHELGHGLGFAPLLCRTAAGCTGPTTAFGGYFNNIPDIWSEFVRDNNAGGTGANRHWVEMTAAERAASFTNDPNLVWNGMSVTTNLGSQAAIARNEGRLRTYAPGTYVQGSSVAHFHSDASPNLLMEPSLNSDVFTQTDLTDCLFQDIGWDDSRCALVLNNAPTLNTIADPPAIDEDAAQQTVNLSGIGDGDTLAQTVSITAVSNNPGLIPNPAVNYVDPNATGTLTYTPVANQSGSAVVTVTARDDGDSAYVPNTLDRTFTVTVNAVNDAPQATNLSASETYTEDTTLDLTDIAVSDIDSSVVTATLTLTPASAGSLTTATVGGSTSSYSAGSGVLTAVGLVADVNGLLAGVSFVPAADSIASATISTSVSDGVAPALTGNKPLAAVAVNDAPRLTNPSATDTYVEDTPFDLSNFVVIDPDNTTLAVTLQLSPAGIGRLSAGTVGGATSTYDAGTGVWQGSGPIANLQQLLDGVTFTPVPDSAAAGTLAISVSDGIAPAVTGSRTLAGTAVNDPPVAGGAQSAQTDEDVPASLALTAADVDSAPLGVVLSADHGTLTLPAVAGLAFTAGDGTGDATMAFNGPIAALNAALGGVTFAPPADYNGTASVTYGLSDGEAAPVSRVVAITIVAAADTVADTIAVAEDGSATFNVLTGAGGASADTFAGAATLVAVSKPAHGAATFAAGGSVTYTPAANYAGSDGFTYTASAGGVTETGQVSIDVGAVNDPPTLNAIPDPAPIPPNAGTQTVQLAGIGAGPGENQTLAVTAASSNPSVIPHPSVSYASPGTTGSIGFAPAHNAVGTVTITVTVTDDGGGANSVSRSFVQQVGVDVLFIDGFE